LTPLEKTSTPQGEDILKVPAVGPPATTKFAPA